MQVNLEKKAKDRDNDHSTTQPGQCSEESGQD
jgi:hypothetical protein